MKKFILRLLFSNADRAIISTALSNYCTVLSNIRNETAQEDAGSAIKLSLKFEYEKVDKVFPIKMEEYSYLKGRVRDLEGENKTQEKCIVQLKDRVDRLEWEKTVV